ncbi:MAG: HEAT repeat domain-containing protein [Planctomycetes bacterium]|nr:HEAT repeat domain-containing protein [Planctomycetota bacterium]
MALAGPSVSASSSACPRCGTIGGYAGRPCPVCFSPSLVLLKDSVLLDAAGKLFPAPAPLRIYRHGRLRIRIPRRARVVAAIRFVTRWTWRSLVIAAAVHLVMVAMAFFIQRELLEYEKRATVLALQADPQTDLSIPAPPVPDREEMPVPGDADDTLVTPSRIIDESILDPGEVDFEQPPERLPFAPLPQTAPPEAAPPQFEMRKVPSATAGLGGGQNDPAPAPQPTGAGLFTNRQGETKRAALQRFGGNVRTENAVDLALAFLARTQSMDGSWDPQGNGTRSFRDGGVMSELREPLSALCVLPFLAGGHSPQDGKYAVNVKRAIGRIMRMQTSDGCLGSYNYHQMYTHGVATLAMCEAYGMTQDKVYLRCAERAIRYIERTQSAKGGWTYMAGLSTPENAGNPLRNDASVTGWMVLALKSAKAVGIAVNERVWTTTTEFFDAMSLPGGETYYADEDPYAWRKGIGMVGVGLTSRVILDREKFEARNDAAQKLLLENTPDYERFKDPSYGSTKPNFNTYYGWYYSTLGMFLHTAGEGPAWRRWNDALQEHLLKHQVLQDKEKGSWDPADSWIGPMIGRLYSTACACLCLEIYYRYTPTFRAEDVTPGAPRPVVETADSKKPAAETPQKPVEIGGESLDLAKAADRSKFLRVLTKEKGMGAAPTLMEALRDESSTVRSTALNQLGNLKAADACKDVTAMLRRDENRDLRSSIAYTLGQLGNDDAANTLIGLLGDSDKMVAEQAHRALVALAGGKDLGVNPRNWQEHFGNK